MTLKARKRFGMYLKSFCNKLNFLDESLSPDILKMLIGDIVSQGNTICYTRFLKLLKAKSSSVVNSQNLPKIIRIINRDLNQHG